MLEFVEEAFYQIALLIDVFVIRDGLRSRSGRRNDSLCTGLCDARTKPIGVIALVGQQMFERHAADEVLGLEDVVHLAAGQDETNGIAKRIHAGADLGAGDFSVGILFTIDLLYGLDDMIARSSR